MTTREILLAANAVKTQAALADTKTKNAALMAMADELSASENEILVANAADLEAADGKISDVMMDRLCLTSARILGMA